jgi:hypothetical protein
VAGVIPSPSFLLPWAAPIGPAALLPTGLRGKSLRGCWALREALQLAFRMIPGFGGRSRGICSRYTHNLEGFGARRRDFQCIRDATRSRKHRKLRGRRYRASGEIFARFHCARRVRGKSLAPFPSASTTHHRQDRASRESHWATGPDTGLRGKSRSLRANLRANRQFSQLPHCRPRGPCRAGVRRKCRKRILHDTLKQTRAHAGQTRPCVTKEALSPDRV